MKTRKATRYGCDYCRKWGGSKAAMSRHETICARNPDRFCYLCHEAGLTQQPIADLIAIVRDTLDAQKVLDAAWMCPACTLAAILQSDVTEPPGAEGDPGVYVTFDYKEALRDFHKESRVHE